MMAIEKLSKENTALREENESLRVEVASLRAEVARLSGSPPTREGPIAQEGERLSVTRKVGRVAWGRCRFVVTCVLKTRLCSCPSSSTTRARWSEPTCQRGYVARGARRAKTLINVCCNVCCVFWLGRAVPPWAIRAAARAVAATAVAPSCRSLRLYPWCRRRGCGQLSPPLAFVWH